MGTRSSPEEPFAVLGSRTVAISSRPWAWRLTNCFSVSKAGEGLNRSGYVVGTVTDEDLLALVYGRLLPPTDDSVTARRPDALELLSRHSIAEQQRHTVE